MVVFFAFVGSLILKGKHLYIDAWDSKPPGIFYLDAFGLWLGRGTRWGIWFIEYLFLFSSAAIGYKLMKKIWNYGAAITGSILWLAVLNGILGGGNLTEEYPLLFNFLALYFFWKSLKDPKRKRYDIVLGITLALSFLFRANNIGVQISIALTYLIIGIMRKDLKPFIARMFVWGIAVLVVFGAVCAYFYSQHTLQAMLEASILYNYSYAGNNANLLSSFIVGFKNFGFVAWFALIAYGYIATTLVKGIKERSVDGFVLMLAIGWPVEIILSSLSGRGYLHYFISWLPVIAMLTGFGFYTLAPIVFSARVLDLICNRTVRVQIGLLILVIFFYWDGLGAYANSFNRIIFNRSAGIQIVSPVAEYIRENTKPEDTVFVWGNQIGINLMAQRDAPTAYLWYPGYVSSSPITQRLANAFLGDLSSHPPAMIIDGYFHAPDQIFSLDPEIRHEQIMAGKGKQYRPYNLNDFFTFVEENYTKTVTLDGYSVYELLP